MRPYDTEISIRRAILAELTADELRGSVDFYELAVADRRVKLQLVDALARSRKVQLDEILQDLSRERLKELCRTFDLDDFEGVLCRCFRDQVLVAAA